MNQGKEEKNSSGQATESPRPALLPCPFCGSATAPRLDWDHLIAEDAWYVVCGMDGCGARSRVFGSYESDYCIKAIAAWNRRATLNVTARDAESATTD